MKLEKANSMTPQQLLDYAVKKLIAQGKRCVEQYYKNGCLYGDKHGNHCLIGWCLDETNTTLMEFEGSVPELVEEEGEAVPTPIVQNISLFDTAQGFHDSPARSIRTRVANVLSDDFGINTSGAHWQQWIELGEEP